LYILPISSYFLPEQNRKFFKPPLGELIRSEEEIAQIIEKLKDDENIPFIVSVGDATTSKLVSYSLIPDLAIVDDRIERHDVPPVDLSNFKVQTAINPAGEITSDAWIKIREALKMESIKTIIKIEGEEDLLVLPAVLEVSTNSKILYGQPQEGLVLITVTEERKQFVKNLMQEKLVKKNGN